MIKQLGIYIHIPFCASKCGYCDFYSQAGCDHKMGAYQKALIRHMEESAEAIRNYEVNTVFFGGGTPSYYGAERIAELLNVLKLNGNLRTDSEITLECNPDSVNYDALRMLREEGVNRLSMGVQCTDDNLLRLIGRRHTFAGVKRAYEEARKAGFENISLDLIYGLPTQRKAEWAESLAKVIEMHPEHISCYGLELHPGTPMYEEYFGSNVMPDEDEQADMYSYAAEMLERYGYHQYEISNFAAKGFESRHNLKYWTLEDYMGFGPGAHSSVGNQRYSYIKDLDGYISGVNRSGVIVDEYQEIDPLERAVEYIMLSMRTAAGISELTYRARCRSDWRPIEKVLQAFREKGWAVKEEDRWHFTVSGFLISNTLIGILLEAQAGGRVEGMPWLEDAFKAEEKISYPKSEEELFREMFDQTVNAGKKE